MSTTTDTIAGMASDDPNVTDRPAPAVSLTRFNGGANRGLCLQLSLKDEYVLLDQAGILRLSRALTSLAAECIRRTMEEAQ